MKAWEALALSKAGDNDKFKRVLEIIKRAAGEGKQNVEIPASLHFQGLGSCLFSYGYQVTYGDAREPGMFVSWAQAEKPVSFDER